MGLTTSDLTDPILEEFIGDQQAFLEDILDKTFSEGDDGFEFTRSVVTNLSAMMALVRLTGGTTSGLDHKIGKLHIENGGFPSQQGAAQRMTSVRSYRSSPHAPSARALSLALGISEPGGSLRRDYEDAVERDPLESKSSRRLWPQSSLSRCSTTRQSRSGSIRTETLSPSSNGNALSFRTACGTRMYVFDCWGSEMLPSPSSTIIEYRVRERVIQRDTIIVN